MALNELVGHEVTVGAHVKLFVHRLTVPCQNLERRTGLPGLEERSHPVVTSSLLSVAAL